MKASEAEETPWLLLIHQLPPRPLYLRAKVRNLLTRVGGVPLKDSVYVLPLRVELLPALRHIVDVAVSGGGEAHLFRGTFLEGVSRSGLVGAFRRARDQDYEALLGQVREWAIRLERRSGMVPPEGPLRLRVGRAKKRLSRIASVDFFGAPRRAEAEAAIAALERRLAPAAHATEPQAPSPALLGRTWVSRRGIQVDRIASAWLVRRFVDTAARFRFIDPHADEVNPGEVTFDMVGGDFTHEDDRCTFETLIRRTRLEDPALLRVAEIVHDIDIKDGKFGRPEARGIEQLLAGLLASTQKDEERLGRGFALLDDLYQSFAHRPASSSSTPKGGGRPGKERKGGPA